MKKIISMLLVLALMITVLTVGMTATAAADTATITIYAIDGSTEVKEFNVGDEFTVYTTLNVSASVPNGMVASVQGSQTYSTDVLALQDETSGQYGEFADVMKVFPVTGDATMANGAQAGKIVYNASTPSINNGFKFDTDHSLLIVTTYEVTAAGAGEVKNAIRNLAAADSAITKLVFEGEVQAGKTVSGTATTEDPTPAIDHAEVRIHSLDGTVETKSFNIGDTFTVYTNLDASSVNDGKMGSVNGTQRYTSTVLELNDTVDADGLITNTTKVFPIMKSNALANAKNAGIIKYSGSSTTGFQFNSAQSQLIVTTYKVTANGYADITNKLNVLAAADEDITRLVFNGETQSGMSYSMPASFTAEGPGPTEPPTEPGPTDPPASTLKVTIINPDNSTVVKEFAVNSTFTVYTVLNAGTTIASVEGTQTYPTASLQLTDAVNGEYNEITDKAAMFPILGDEAVATAQNGTIKFNASRGTVNGGYAFNSDTAKLIVTNYKVLATGTATIKTTLKTLIKDNADATKIVFNGAAQSGQSYQMPGSFTDPGNPVIPTEPPVTEPPATEPPVTEPPVPDDKAVVTIYGIDGTSKTKTYSIGDEFTVYTTFDASQACANGMIASISASQTFTAGILQSTDEVDELSVVVNNTEMFPVLGDKAVAKITEGLNKYNASTPNIGQGFQFNDPNALLIVTNYKVVAAGNAEVRNTLTTVAAADANLTRIVNKGVVADGKVINGIATFWDPSQPEPTEPPATEPPATEPPATEPPVQEKAIVTVYGFDGSSETKSFDVGETFTVYTTLNAGQTLASINATQTFTASILTESDAVDAQGVVADSTAMFPILGDAAIARVTTGKIQYNASTPSIGNGFAFDKDDAILIVTTYTVTKAGEAEIRNSLTTVAAADANLTRIVDKGVIAPGEVIGGEADFEEPHHPTETYRLGDADNNDQVDSVDVAFIQRYCAMMRTGLDEDIMVRNGDVDGNGYLEIVDATLIQRYLAMMKVDYPIDELVEV